MTTSNLYQIVRIAYCHYENIQTGYPIDLLEQKLKQDDFGITLDNGFFIQYAKANYDANGLNTILFLSTSGIIIDVIYSNAEID